MIRSLRVVPISAAQKKQEACPSAAAFSSLPTADVALEAKLNLPRGAVAVEQRRDEVGVAVGQRLRLAAEARRDVFGFGGERGLVDGDELAVCARPAGPPTSTVSTARPASENTICRAALLNGTNAGSLRSRIIRSAAMPGLSAPTCAVEADGLGAGQRRGLERIGGVDRMRLRIGHGGQQAQHPHGDEDVLRLGATVVVAAERDLDAGAVQIEDRRDAALELEIADRVVHHAGAGLREHGDVARGEPDAVHEIEPLVHQPGVRQQVEQRERAARARRRPAAASRRHG